MKEEKEKSLFDIAMNSKLNSVLNSVNKKTEKETKIYDSKIDKLNLLSSFNNKNIIKNFKIEGQIEDNNDFPVLDSKDQNNIYNSFDPEDESNKK